MSLPKGFDKYQPLSTSSKIPSFISYVLLFWKSAHIGLFRVLHVKHETSQSDQEHDIQREVEDELPSLLKVD